MNHEAEQNWLENQQYQTILRLTHTIAFEFNLQTGEHFVSPFISETLAGSYDDRQLSHVMLEDGVLHADDTAQMLAFRDCVLSRKCRNETILMRLKTVKGKFRWYRMSICISDGDDNGNQVVVGTLTDTEEEMELREKLRRIAQHDEITGIYNKQAFYAETERLLNVDKTRQYYIVLFDVNRFKMVNELFGIREGDKLLKYIGQSVAECVRQEEAYGRIRDDVFCLCVCREEPEIVRLIDELRAKISNAPLSFSLTISVGAYRVEDTAMPISIMVDRASLAMRTVKNRAMGGHAFYKPELGSSIVREQIILGEMQEGLKKGQFEVYYQTKHRISSKELIGAEALVRWIHPEKGIVPPAEFIGLFERNGLITILDEYVWETVCRDLRKWLDMGITPPPVSVNVSRIHLYNPKLGEKFVELIDKYNLSPSLFEIELTESAYVENPYLGELMEALHTKGFTFLMDDFGSGYSSLNMLRSIPVDILKMDLHFLNFTKEEPSGKIIMESVIQMAHRLKIFVIAEGVETPEQADFLQAAGCTMAQGYYYSKPMRREDYESKYLMLR